MSAAARGARVRIPPPLIFAGGWLAAWALHRRIGFVIDDDGAGRPQRVIGGMLLAVGVFAMGWAIRTLLMARTTILPHGAVRQVVSTGPYRLTRNPIYLGMTAIYLGAALLSNLAWPIVLLPMVLVVLTTAVIAHEERYLLATFGESYERYRRRVRRWI